MLNFISKVRVKVTVNLSLPGVIAVHATDERRKINPTL